MVYIEGKLRTRSWEKEGVTRYTTEIIADQMQMLGGREGGGSSSYESMDEDQSRPQQSRPQRARSLHSRLRPSTILQRLREIEQVADIVPASKIPTGNIIGIAGLETGEWGSILSAMPMVTRPKQCLNPEDDYVFGVMAAVAPQFRSDASDRTQIAHLTAS